MGKAQEMVRCHKCNVSCGAGVACKCSPPWPMPDAGPFVRDMLASLARNGEDPFKPISTQCEQNESLGHPESLAKLCNTVRAFIEQADGLSLECDALISEARLLLGNAQDELRKLAWSRPVASGRDMRCGECGDFLYSKCKRDISAGIDCDGVEIWLKHPQSTPGGQPLMPPLMELPPERRHGKTNDAQLEKVREWQSKYDSFTYAKVDRVADDGVRVMSVAESGYQPVFLNMSSEDCAHVLVHLRDKKTPLYIVFGCLTIGRFLPSLLYASTSPLTAEARRALKKRPEDMLSSVYRCFEFGVPRLISVD